VSRKEIVVTVPLDGRDKNKRFKIVEMPASQAEAWGARLMLALAASGADVPPNLMDMGMAGVAAMGIRAIGGIKWAEAKPLLDEMFACVSVMRDPAHPDISWGPLVEQDIEEVRTRIWLREKVIALHTDFSIAAYTSGLRTAQAQIAASDNGQTIETLNGRSAR
jgi:hypothetical protein